MPNARIALEIVRRTVTFSGFLTLYYTGSGVSATMHVPCLAWQLCNHTDDLRGRHSLGAFRRLNHTLRHDGRFIDVCTLPHLLPSGLVAQQQPELVTLASEPAQ
jgi:hypothetical protein